MPLHLAQHKSYHPYNRANQERVHRDQARAAQQEAEQRKTSFADRNRARLEALRSGRKGPEGSSPTTDYLGQSTESNRAQRGSAQKSSSLSQEARSGHSLLQPHDELKPWYTSPHLRNSAEIRKTEEQRLEDAYKDSTIKSSNDPLKAMQSFLAKRKAVKHLPQAPSSSKSHPEEVSDLYEPDAVRAAEASRRRRPSHSAIASPGDRISSQAHARREPGHREHETHHGRSSHRTQFRHSRDEARSGRKPNRSRRPG